MASVEIDFERDFAKCKDFVSVDFAFFSLNVT